MWYKFAIKYNIFGLPIQGDMPIKEFASEDEDLNLQDINEDEDEILNVESQDQEITVDDPTPEDEFTPEDLQKNIEILEQDPTSNFALPPIRDFLYKLYFSSSIEDIVRPSEVNAIMKKGGVRKENFINFLL